MSDGNHAATFVYLVGCLLLVASALASRRLPLGQTAKMVVAWVLIFAVVVAAFALRDDFRALGGRIWSQGMGEPVIAGGTVRIQRDSDGHYWVNARVNDEIVRFLVDSGATVTAIGKETAQRAGVEPEAGFPVAVNTANGTIFMRRATAERVMIGTIERKAFPVWVGQGEDDVNVLGMNFLSSLSSWGTEGGWLVLRP